MDVTSPKVKSMLFNLTCTAGVARQGGRKRDGRSDGLLAECHTPARSEREHAAFALH
jgi:hypothetical protein